jgi:hypothetical protein
MTPEIKTALMAAPFHSIAHFWKILEQDFPNEIKPWLAQNDRYYLLVKVLHRTDAIHPWLYARTREVEQARDGHLDLWAREHYKSTIITFAGIIQEVINNPEITIGLFSHTKPIAKAFLRQIQKEFENNTDLRGLFPGLFWTTRTAKRPVGRWTTALLSAAPATPRKIRLRPTA